jgi:ABC-type polysaccharide/polyol phosphate transport system ATPase subunit
MSRERRPIVEVSQLGICYEREAPARNPALSARGRSRVLLRSLIDATLARPAPLVHWALRDVNLTCHEGEVIGIVGPNGAGKTTLCLAVSEILEPDEGTVRTRGRISALLSLGTGFRRELSGRANIRIYAAFLGISRAHLDAKMDEIIAFTELGDMIDEPIGHYSTGMRARLSFAVATTLDPEILLLDEILSVGDHAFRKKSGARIRSMMKNSKLILIVSHSSSLIRELCTHCLWLDSGRVRMYGEANEVMEAYEAESGEVT